MTSLSMRQFSVMVTEVGDNIEDRSTARQTTIKADLNTAYAAIATIREWDELITVDESGRRQLDSATPGTLVQDEAEMPLPWNCTRLKGLTYRTRSTGKIDIIEESDLFRLAGSQMNSTGTPRIACVLSRTAQYNKYTAAAAGTLEFKSTSVNANQTIRVHLQKSTAAVGEYQWVDLSSADWVSTKATSPTVALGWPIKRISIPSTWVDDLIVTDLATSNKQLVRIMADEHPVTAANSKYTVADRLLLRVWPVPSEDLGLTVSYWRRPEALTEDEDTPLMPVSDFMVFKASGTGLRRMGDHKGAREYEREAGALLEAASVGGTLHRRQQATVAGGSVLGMTGVSSRTRWN